MPDRRTVLAGLMAVGMSPRATWADIDNPAYLTAGMRPDGVYVLCGLTDAGEIAFELSLPARGHAAAAHPSRPVAVAFARRPGRFALVIDCASGQMLAQLNAPTGRHFYGHGAFSADGVTLYTTENDYDAARGVVGLWAANDGFRRIGEFYSGGVGPHEMLRLPGSDDLVVANGGLETHPETGRAKLNLPLMRPNLTYLSAEGDVLEQVELDPTLHQNSIRHLDALPTGDVAFAMQWEGAERETPPLLGLHRRGATPRLLSAPSELQARMAGYAGSVAFAGDGETVAITSPRGGMVHVFATRMGNFLHHLDTDDVCGLAAGVSGGSFQLTTGTGATGAWDGSGSWSSSYVSRAFDNHLVKVA